MRSQEEQDIIDSMLDPDTTLDWVQRLEQLEEKIVWLHQQCEMFRGASHERFLDIEGVDVIDAALKEKYGDHDET